MCIRDRVKNSFVDGLGNTSGQLGHNLMDNHFQVGAYGKYEGYENKYYKGSVPKSESLLDDDIKIFQEIGISTVVCGPGSIEQAHKIDEFIILDELKKCLKLLDGIKEKSSLN